VPLDGESRLGSVEAQAIPGEMNDATAAPPEPPAPETPPEAPPETPA